MSSHRHWIIIIAAPLVVNCSGIIPDVPNNYALPIEDILHNTTCELRQAFLELNQNKQFAAFKANNWLIGLTLSPKTDKEVIAGVGLTGKSHSFANPPYFNSWAIGSAALPGANGDFRGTRNAGITYNIHSRDLLNVRKYPIYCDPTGPTYSVLAEHLGVREWLIRTVLAQYDTTGSLTKLDKPTFSSEIFVKFIGAGNFTYNFPFGTDFAALSGSYDEDITFSIALTADSQVTIIKVQTLPTGGNFGEPAKQPIQTSVNVGAQSRLDSLEAQQQIVNQLKNINSNGRGR
jgi:hypothetical protein